MALSVTKCWSAAIFGPPSGFGKETNNRIYRLLSNSDKFATFSRLDLSWLSSHICPTFASWTIQLARS
jgi:hypothetical protein